MKFRLNRTYLFLSLLILGVEVFIAARLNDSIIRPYGGDFLVVILLYCLIRAFLDTRMLSAALTALSFACLVETLQYFRLADHLGLKAHSIPRIMLGDYFTWTDILSYTLGIATVIILERRIGRNDQNTHHERSICK